MSDTLRPDKRATQAIAEFAAFCGAGKSETRIRELVNEGIEMVRIDLNTELIMVKVLELLTDPDRW